ncbi:hypothetical protein GCM10025865_24830 [Paraoerskovia sediminicola]|uniref:DegV family EDD domain-containing protein n=1 Tax=Paraoerskovia sediminicola TaxID=1138587 RepID=A0ABN6XE99_9CELL|nr:hypothetical protein GCM10025865_24830 [Paraoerskovia sediminicola]
MPLTVIVGDESYAEGTEITDDDLAAYLRAGAVVSTSQPSSEALLEAYRRAADAGATEIVSVHLSADLSGTLQAATAAAGRSPVPVRVVDSRTVAMSLGFAALAAAQEAARGAAPQRSRTGRARWPGGAEPCSWSTPSTSYAAVAGSAPPPPRSGACSGSDRCCRSATARSSSCRRSARGPRPSTA